MILQEKKEKVHIEEKTKDINLESFLLFISLIRAVTVVEQCGLPELRKNTARLHLDIPL